VDTIYSFSSFRGLESFQKFKALRVLFLETEIPFSFQKPYLNLWISIPLIYDDDDDDDDDDDAYIKASSSGSAVRCGHMINQERT